MNTRRVAVKLLARRCLLLVAVCLVSACTTVPMGKAQASIENIKLARAAGIKPVAVGNFVWGPPADAEQDASARVRAATLTAPDGSFARYLKATLEAELAGAGLLESNAAARVEGVLLQREVDASIGQGKGLLAARFVVRRDNQQVYERELSVDATWDSPFVGVVAIPAAINQFTLLFRKMVGRLLVDPDFVAASK